jgi:hypothetical protein
MSVSLFTSVYAVQVIEGTPKALPQMVVSWVAIVSRNSFAKVTVIEARFEKRIRGRQGSQGPRVRR